MPVPSSQSWTSASHVNPVSWPIVVLNWFRPSALIRLYLVQPPGLKPSALTLSPTERKKTTAWGSKVRVYNVRRCHCRTLGQGTETVGSYFSSFFNQLSRCWYCVSAVVVLSHVKIWSFAPELKANCNRLESRYPAR